MRGNDVTTQGLMFRGQYRPLGHRGPWQTVCERASQAAVWDELLTTPALAGCDLRVRRIEVAEMRPRASESAPPCPAAPMIGLQPAASSFHQRNR
jgi:hypothetical protein